MINVDVCFSLYFSCLDSVGQLLSAHESHEITSTHYAYNSAPPTTRPDGFLRTTTSSCYLNARSRMCCCNTRTVLLQYTLLQHPLSSKGNASSTSWVGNAAMDTWRRKHIYDSSCIHAERNYGTLIAALCVLCAARAELARSEVQQSSIWCTTD